MDNGMGLVKIRNFNSNADKEFRETVNSLTAQGEKNEITLALEAFVRIEKGETL